MMTMDSNMNIKAKVEIALNAIRPYLEADGGDVKVLDVTDEGLVTLELLGNCGSCPMSAMTLKAGVEDAIKRAVPEVSAVEAVNMTTPDDPWAKMPFE
ncbi:Fe-S cluster biogenesis protein NfuA, 4Fe-4S-binding domain [Catalinimonas alkaloidigena]|uniref:Fe-S cluster biogenesis protein NfuA, 4Fe-4S-binding domain n=2 Tax=Catalinimonas alkaloidigena TaxID=1075417 RepID=A0A1G9LR85_9BACT|nr:Fe-S cluster biogenesis protein NfuA, 4Fe-4S-binding domain [Catalinimonas alkaloidigena]